MIQSTLLLAADYPRMPWKNGGGSTEEITRDGGTGLESFGWRLSIADIAESGGFSSFSGYQRIISVLQGTGMTLNVDGQDSQPLLPLQPFAFSGASQVACSLLDGPIRDFNLIYAPQRFRARLQWLSGHQRFFTQAGTVLVFSVDAHLQVSLESRQQHVLGLHDCLRFEAGHALLHLQTQGQCCVIELTAH
ncbi:HutD family protein [Pseudomonas sp. LD120]|uniref:HutD/Ves family protein n=1 Tax=Pseudomonas sp. LD120 TaxID=485751 RepID=UPI001356E1B1|nr:HutD family protein [Pseudomonas sp. LD120]KAF0862433.1 HutD family protein [Pseudomonas sp. LD120]